MEWLFLALPLTCSVTLGKSLCFSLLLVVLPPVAHSVCLVSGIRTHSCLFKLPSLTSPAGPQLSHLIGQTARWLRGSADLLLGDQLRAAAAALDPALLLPSLTPGTPILVRSSRPCLGLGLRLGPWPGIRPLISVLTLGSNS